MPWWRGPARWLAAEPRDVLRLEPLTGARAGTRDAPLQDSLGRWRARLQRRRAGIVLRRQLLLAALPALALEGLVLAGVLGQPLLALALLMAIAGTVAELLRGPSLEDVAKLLDERLHLFDRITTGLAIETSAAGARNRGQLERRALTDASLLADETLGSWRAAGRGAPAEWGGLLAAAAVLAVLLLQGPAHRTSVVATTRPAGHGTHATAATKAPAGPAASRRVSPTPTGARTSSPGARSTVTSGSSSRTRGGQSTRRTTPASTRTSGGTARGSGSGHRAAPTFSTGTAAGSGHAPAGGGSSAARGSRRTGGGGDGSSSGTPASAGNRAAGSPSPKAAGERPSTESRGATSTSPAAAGLRSSHPGAPAGSPTAGSARGGNRSAGAHRITGSTSGILPLQAGYGSASGPRGSARSSTSASGGGHGHEAPAAAGGGEGAGGRLGLVPADGGAGPQSFGALLIAYFEALGTVQGRRW
jgi:hypothetical protein